MSTDLFIVRDSYDESLNVLLDMRDNAASDQEKAELQTEINILADKLATVQSAINSGAAADLDAIADTLEERIQSLDAMGFKKAAERLGKALKRIRPKSENKVSLIQRDTANLKVAAGIEQGKKGIVAEIISVSDKKGFPALWALCIVAIESDFRPRAKNPLSSAGGLFQFIDSTWKGAGGSEIPGAGGKGNGFAASAQTSTQIEIGINHLIGLRDDLKGAGVSDPTATAIYMAHQQGFGGATRILKADRLATIESVIGDEAARNNRLEGLTVQQAIQRFEDLVTAHLAEVKELVEPDTPAPPAAPTGPGDRPLANRAVSVAVEEMKLFSFKNGKKITEESEPLHARGLEYFRMVNSHRETIVGNSNPWSAAYISFVMRAAGFESTIFPFAPNHARYILQALTNRKKNDAVQATETTTALVYYELHEFAPRVGDLVGNPSTVSTSPLTNAFVKTTADIALHLPKHHFPSHTDLVIDVRDGLVTVIGGNVSDTIKTRKYELDADGHIKSGQRPKFVLAINV